MGVEKISSPCCQLCGAEEPTVKIIKAVNTQAQVCSSCCSLIETLNKNPALIGKVIPYIQDASCSQSCGTMNNVSKIQDAKDAKDAQQATIPKLSHVLNVLDGKRYRTIDRDQNKWYLSVSEVNGRPVEIFASTAFDRDHELQSRISNLTTITRLISLILRHIFLGEIVTLEKCLQQIQRSSRNKNDLPDMLYRILNRYTKTK